MPGIQGKAIKLLPWEGAWFSALLSGQGKAIKLRVGLSSCWLHCAAWPGPGVPQHEETWGWTGGRTDGRTGATEGHRRGSVSGFCFRLVVRLVVMCFEVQTGDLPWKCGTHCIQNSSIFSVYPKRLNALCCPNQKALDDKLATRPV